MKVFIAGPISSRPDTYRDDFAEAEDLLEAQGHVVFNPAELPQDDSISQGQYLGITFAMIDACDAVYMLSGWKNSAGAMKEYEYARLSDKYIADEEEGEYNVG